ncbi:MAG: M23 family metallopeptidase [Bacteroidales bacterium]
MKISPILFVYILLLFPLTQLSAQKTIPQGYFSPPLDINLGITGSFSEIRPNHFHSGTDFHVQQKEGLPVYAVADGFVSRIKVSPVGFGNALYIDHPNGYTSVYAHLEKYSDTITQYLRSNQYRLKSFDVDLFPAHKKDSIYVKRGQLIGYAGNSGSSGGAHLHFELRTTVTERIINPLLFGFDIADIYPPFIDFIKIYPEGDQSFIGASPEPKRFALRKAPDGDYRLAEKDTITAWGNFSIGAQAFDYNQNQTDRNGFYSMRMYHNYVEFFSMECDSFSFDESRYVNASIDYADNYNLGNRILKSKKLPGNKLSFFKTDAANGIINVTDGLLHEVHISVVDLSGNMANLRFWIQSQKPLEVVQTPASSDVDTSVFFRFDKVNRFETGELKVDLPVGCLYDNLNFTYKKAPGNKTMFSDIHYLNNPECPCITV